ncbi:hypothetical protein DS884_03490 [Tenacibaculum sp. E3R01]|uniref:hypothetical protein n=1 Tax=Tenacibaculum sp. E3R01 TaxID=2267227 RepID=UPI000DEB570E|nr:hypothetical protein [Tenacibaculum sp. E3R01]RBW61385.1 hypothetical protein DS884_03490 [Tenacibaculum sp. E3R01]
MISFVKRKDLEIEKYNDCIINSLQSNVFGFSWYLDIIADDWSVLVLNDYEAVMPLPFRKKAFIKYVYPPFWLIQLGIYSKEVEDENEFLIELFENFKFVELRLNYMNSFSMFSVFQQERRIQVLSLKQDYEIIYTNYNRNRKRELKKAVIHDLNECWSDCPTVLINLFKENVGKRVKKISEKDYDRLLSLMQVCIRKKVGELLTVYDMDNRIVSGAFFLKHKKRVTELVCSSDFKNRKNGANTFMNDRAIYKYSRNFDVFDFGGSSMKNIANYYKSFGAVDEKYIQLYYNDLSKFIKFFKR